MNITIVTIDNDIELYFGEPISDKESQAVRLVWLFRLLLWRLLLVLVILIGGVDSLNKLFIDDFHPPSVDLLRNLLMMLDNIEHVVHPSLPLRSAVPPWVVAKTI